MACTTSWSKFSAAERNSVRFTGSLQQPGRWCSAKGVAYPVVGRRLQVMGCVTPEGGVTHPLPGANIHHCRTDARGALVIGASQCWRTATLPAVKVGWMNRSRLAPGGCGEQHPAKRPQVNHSLNPQVQCQVGDGFGKGAPFQVWFHAYEEQCALRRIGIPYGPRAPDQE